MADKYSLYYWKINEETQNFGEIFVPHILTLFEDVVDDKSDHCLLTIGSFFYVGTINFLIEQFNYKKITIWGTGYSYDGKDNHSEVDILAVRGPLTAETYNLPDIPQGDPGFLLPMALNLDDVQRHSDVVSAPHIHNRQFQAWFKYKNFNVEMKPENFVTNARYLKGAEFVLTSSLHIAIFCLAYNVPFGLVLGPGERINLPLKFHDTFQWLGIPLEWHTTELGARRWYDKICDYKIPDLQPLIDSFPGKEI